MEILNLRDDGNGGYIANGLVPMLSTNQLIIDWIAENKEVMPPLTVTEKNAIVLWNKWALVETERKTLTVTTTAGHKFSASPNGIAAIIRKDASMLSTDTCTWYEDWGSFQTNKVELQEALNLANIADQALLDSIMV